MNIDKRIIRKKDEIIVLDLKNIKGDEIFYEGEFPELGKIIFMGKEKDDKIIMYSHVGKKLLVNNKTLQELQEKIWYVINSTLKDKHSIIPSEMKKDMRFKSNYKYCLRKNDIIKLGRIKYLVKDMGLVNGYIETAQETFIPHYDIE